MKHFTLLLSLLVFVSCSGFTGLNNRGYTKTIAFKSVKEFSGEEIFIKKRLINFFPYDESEEVELKEHLLKFNVPANKEISIYKIETEMDATDVLFSLIPFVTSRTYKIVGMVADKK
ncbi:MAG: hypothetical protein U0T83_10650 [Bacteriovoracaceae bacterium]